MTSGKWFRENVCRSKSPCISFTIAFNISGRWDGSIFLRSISSCSSMWTLSVLMIFNCKAIDSRGSRYDGAKLSCKWWNCSVPAVYRLWDRIIQLRGALARCTWEFALLCYRSVVQFHLIILALYSSATFLVIAKQQSHSSLPRYCCLREVGLAHWNLRWWHWNLQVWSLPPYA